MELEFSGADTELDKLIVENLVDPLQPVPIVDEIDDHVVQAIDRLTELGELVVAHQPVEIANRLPGGRREAPVHPADQLLDLALERPVLGHGEKTIWPPFCSKTRP